MFARKITFIIVLLSLYLETGLYAQDIAQWDFDRLGNHVILQDKISNLKGKVTSKQTKTISVISKDEGSCIFFGNSRDDSDPDNKMLIVDHNDILTGYNENRYGYGSFTIELEIMPTEIKQCQLVRKTEGTTNIGYQLWMTKDGKLGFSIGIGKGLYHRVISKRKIEVDKWHKVMATWDGRYKFYNMQLHIDGYIAWGGAAPTVSLSNNKGPLTIGGLCYKENDYGQFFAGYMKNLKLSFNRPRLLNISGSCDPYEVKQTGLHLKNQPGYIDSGFIYKEPPTPECHSSSIVDLGNGKLAAAWFGGTHEGHTDVAIWFSSYDGKKWSKPKAVVPPAKYNKVSHISQFNPVLFKHSSDKLLLFYKDGWLEHMECRLITSDDDGKTWSAIKYYEPPLHGPSKNKPIELSDGSLLCTTGGDLLEITADLGNTWRTVKVPNPGNFFFVIQPAILVHQDGKLQALYRTREGKLAQSWSYDNGNTWSDLELSNMTNNNSGIDAVTLKDGRHLLVYNHTGLPKGKWGGPRSPLNVSVSEDGINWQAALILEDEPGEYSYPAVIQADDGKVHITYTWNRMRVKHVIIDPDKLQLRDLVNGNWPGS